MGARAQQAHTVPRSLRSRPVTMVARLGGGVGLDATWDHLGLFPSRTSGVAERGEEGRLGESAPALLSQHPEEGRALASLPPPTRRPRSNVVRPRWTNRRSARRHDNCSIRRGHPAAPSLRSHPPDGERPRGCEATAACPGPLPGCRWKPGNLVAKMHALPGACDDAAFQGGFSAFGTETCEPWKAQAGTPEAGLPIQGWLCLRRAWRPWASGFPSGSLD